jgi:hypothetical protein
MEEVMLPGDEAEEPVTPGRRIEERRVGTTEGTEGTDEEDASAVMSECQCEGASACCC